MLELGSKEEIKVKKEELIENVINQEYMERLKKYVKKIYTVEHAKDYVKKRNKKKS